MEDCQLLYFRFSDEVKIILRYMYFISVHMNNDPFNTNIDSMYNSLQNKKQKNPSNIIFNNSQHKCQLLRLYIKSLSLKRLMVLSDKHGVQMKNYQFH